MKNAVKTLVFLFGICLVLFTSCQSEEVAISSNKTITSTSPLKKLLMRVTQKSTLRDNVIDSTSCFTVKLPVTVIVNNQEINVASQDDYTIVSNVLDENNDDEDHVGFVFPITVVFSDYSEQTINNEDELEAIHDSCEEGDVDNDDDDENDNDDDEINCVSIVYPMTISTYDSNNQVAETITIANDEQLHLLMSNIDDTEYVSINYPVSVVDSDGQVISIENNDQLESVIDGCGDNESEDDESEDDENEGRNLIITPKK